MPRSFVPSLSKDNGRCFLRQAPTCTSARRRRFAPAACLCRAKAGDPPAHWGIEVVADPHPAAPFLLCHEPPADSGDHASASLFGYALAGHVHPGVHIAGAGLQSERLPCFVLGKSRAILPAFGRFTGLATQSWKRSDRVIANAGERLFALPRHASRT